MALVLFDLDGTLVPHEAWNPVFRRIAEAIAERAATRPEEVWRLVLSRHLELVRRLDWRAFDWQLVYDEAAQALGVRAPDVVEVLTEFLHSFRPVEGALEALRTLREAGFRLGIATNGHLSYQIPVVKQLGLDRFVEEVRTSDLYRCPKSCWEFFEGAAAMVGDNPVFDVLFPRRFGMKTVFYGRWDEEARRQSARLGIRLDAVRPDAEVLSLAEAARALLTLLDEGQGRGSAGPRGLPKTI